MYGSSVVLTDAELTRDQAGHLTDGAIEAVRAALAQYVACLDAWYLSPQPPDVVTAKQRVAADRARAEIEYLQAAAVIKAWADSRQRPDLSAWAWSVGMLRDMADAWSDQLGSMEYGWYPHRRQLWSGRGW